MGAEKGNKPVFEDKERNIKLAIFKNKNTRGTKYPVICITVLRFPFKYSQKLWITPQELERIAMLQERVPEIKVEQRKKK